VIIGSVQSTDNYIICNIKVKDFRATQASVSLRDTAKQVVISRDVANALKVEEGDWVRLVAN
jgi:arginine N-succinyltransferase